MARPRVPLISKHRALEVALEIIEAEGIEGLSIRNLADRLKVTGASLYHHFENKDAIVVGAARLALEVAPEPKRDGEPWRAWLVRDARRHRRAYRDHPDLAAVLLRHLPADLGVARAEAMAARLEADGVPAGAIVPLLEALERYAIGSALHESREGVVPIDRPFLAKASAHRSVTADEVFDLVCHQIIDAVLGTAGGD
ncbi:TetR family transcriptional regulator [Pseudonocardia acaciae]|uniref:TetR family transcriptional regulator n=1 Tax=Pseudonocardia acaciae TaxID=551276 RepID=UPI0006853491|nr:TetR family transcriptional regulator [Pseudonocardia acaciae]